MCISDVLTRRETLALAIAIGGDATAASALLIAAPPPPAFGKGSDSGGEEEEEEEGGVDDDAIGDALDAAKVTFEQFSQFARTPDWVYGAGFDPFVRPSGGGGTDGLGNVDPNELHAAIARLQQEAGGQ